MTFIAPGSAVAAQGTWQGPGTGTQVQEAYSNNGNSAGIGFVGSIGTYGWQLCCADGVVSQGYSPIANGTLALALPNYAQVPYTIDQIGAYSTAVAGAQLRGGLYLIADQSRPFDLKPGISWATLLSDAGVLSAAGSGPVVFTLPTPIVIPGGTWFTVGMAGQGSAPPQIFTEQYKHTAWGVTAPGGACLASVNITGVVGALPLQAVLPSPPFGGANLGAGCYYHRSA